MILGEPDQQDYFSLISEWQVLCEICEGVSDFQVR